jgi:hypothetical protein
MCVMCAAIPAAAAIGAKLSADQIHKEESRRLPVPKITALALGTLMIASAIYHTLRWESS